MQENIWQGGFKDKVDIADDNWDLSAEGMPLFIINGSERKMSSIDTSLK